MRPMVPVSYAFAVAAAATFLLPVPRGPVLAALALAYLAVCIRASASIRSRLLGTAITSAPGAGPHFALTYDDGPDPDVTPALLDLLARRGVQAAFFCVGKRVAAHPDLARRCLAEGHLVENHSHSHAYLTNCWFTARLTAELEQCQATIESTAGRAPRYFRPPLGLRSHTTQPATRSLGLTVVGWSVRGLDTGRRSEQAVIERVVAGLSPGAIVLLHDGGLDSERVCRITAKVLDQAAQQGLTAVRLDELLGSAEAKALPGTNTH